MKKPLAITGTLIALNGCVDPNETAEPLTAEEASQCIRAGLDHLEILLEPLELEDGSVQSIRASMANDLEEVMQEPGLGADIETGEFGGLTPPLTLVIEREGDGGDTWFHFFEGIIPESDFVVNPDPESPEYTVFSPEAPGLSFSSCHQGGTEGLGLFNYMDPQLMSPRQPASGLAIFPAPEIAPDDEGHPRWGFFCDADGDGVIEVGTELVAYYGPFWHYSITEEGGISVGPPCGTDLMESAMNADHLDGIHQALGAFESAVDEVVDRWKGSGATAWTEYEVVHFEE